MPVVRCYPLWMAFLVTIKYQFPPWSVQNCIHHNMGAPWGTFSYKVIPFGLRNSGATKLAMEYVFNNLAEIILALLDDLMTKSMKCVDHIQDPHTIFTWFCKYNIRINTPNAYSILSLIFIGIHHLTSQHHCHPIQISSHHGLTTPMDSTPVVE